MQRCMDARCSCTPAARWGGARTIAGVRPRFYVPDLDASGQAVLARDEAEHLVRVLRLGAGAEIDVLDGRGGMFHARVVELNRSGARIAVLAPTPAAPEPRLQVTLVVSVLKGDKMDDVVRDAVMLGASAIQPVVAARSEVSLAALSRGHRVERWARIAVASVKQCGRAVVPPVRQPLGIDTWMARRLPVPTLVLREPAAGLAQPLRDVTPSTDVQLLVGPEGGWSSDELAAFDAAGFESVSLGARTIRADAAPAVAMAALFEAWNGW